MAVRVLCTDGGHSCSPAMNSILPRSMLQHGPGGWFAAHTAGTQSTLKHAYLLLPTCFIRAGCMTRGDPEGLASHVARSSCCWRPLRLKDRRWRAGGGGVGCAWGESNRRGGDNHLEAIERSSAASTTPCALLLLPRMLNRSLPVAAKGKPASRSASRSAGPPLRIRSRSIMVRLLVLCSD